MGWIDKLLRKQIKQEKKDLKSITSEKENKPELVKETIYGFINPLWEIEVLDYDGKQIIKWPFCFFVHYVLKAQGFEPDKQVDTPPEVILRLGKGAEAKLPLFVKSIPNDWNKAR